MRLRASSETFWRQVSPSSSAAWLSERPKPSGSAYSAGELVEAQQRVEDVGRAPVGAVGRRLVGGAGEDEVAGPARRRARPPRPRWPGGACGSAAAPLPSGPAGRLAQRRAQAGDRLGVLRGGLAQLLDLAQELLAVRADGVELVEQRLVRGEPLVGGLAARPGGLLGLLAALGQVRLGGGGARLGALELRLPGARRAR